eukprot:6616457-Pyramimonas_sp.AAC.1
MSFSGEQLKYGLVYWGSPHWGDTSTDGNWRKWRDSAQFKTNAFESMSRLSGGALTLMTLGEHYKEEFWSP